MRTSLLVLWPLLVACVDSVSVNLDSLYDIDSATCTTEQLDTLRVELERTYTFVDRCQGQVTRLRDTVVYLDQSGKRLVEASWHAWATDEMAGSSPHVSFPGESRTKLQKVSDRLGKVKDFLNPSAYTAASQTHIQNRPYLGCDLTAFDFEESDNGPVMIRRRPGKPDVVLSGEEYGCSCALGSRGLVYRKAMILSPNFFDDPLMSLLPPTIEPSLANGRVPLAGYRTQAAWLLVSRLSREGRASIDASAKANRGHAFSSLTLVGTFADHLYELFQHQIIHTLPGGPECTACDTSFKYESLPS